MTIALNKFKSAMVVVFNDKNEVLILKRSVESRWMPEKWGIPGGHVEDGELPEDAGIRETLEETSLQLDNVFELKKINDVVIYYSNSYSGEVEIDFEHTDWTWVSYDDLGNYDTTPNLEDTVKLALGKLK